MRTNLGWGEAEDNRPSKGLKSVKLRVRTRKECSSNFRSANYGFRYSTKMLCAGAGTDRSICFMTTDDTGGPLT